MKLSDSRKALRFDEMTQGKDDYKTNAINFYRPAEL
jgi:hypothetical protein